jgi:hypothetical protein
MGNPIYTLTRLLTTIQKFTDEQTDQLEELLGFGYNPDDAYEALNQLQAIRDIPEESIKRVHEFIKAFEDYQSSQTGLTSKGVISSVGGGYEGHRLLAHDIKRLLRASGVFKIDSGAVRIGHPTKGVVHDWSEQPEGGYTVTAPAEPGEPVFAHPTKGVVDSRPPGEHKRLSPEDQAMVDLVGHPGESWHRQRAQELRENLQKNLGPLNGTQRDVLRRIERVDRQKSVSPEYLADLKRRHPEANYVSEASLAEDLKEAGIPVSEAAEELLKDWELLDTDDAAVWAHEFTKRYWSHWTPLDPRALPMNDIEALMLSWFASAVETGKRVGAEKARERLIAAEEEKAFRLLDAARKQAREDEQNEGVPTATIGELTITGPDMEQVMQAVATLAEDNLPKGATKVVPASAIVIDIDAVNTQIRETIDKALKDLQQRNY